MPHRFLQFVCAIALLAPAGPGGPPQFELKSLRGLDFTLRGVSASAWISQLSAKRDRFSGSIRFADGGVCRNPDKKAVLNNPWNLIQIER